MIKKILLVLSFILLFSCSELFISGITYIDENGNMVDGFYYYTMGIDENGKFFHKRETENTPCSEAVRDKEKKECEFVN